MTQSNLVVVFTTAYLLIAAIFLLFTARFLYRLLRGIGRVVFRESALFGTDPRTRLISFGVAALAFPSVVPWAVFWSVFAFVTLFNDLPRWWLANWQRSTQLCDVASPTLTLSQCLGQAGFGFFQAIGNGLSDAYNNLRVNDAPMRDAVFLLVVWALLAQFFSTVDAGATGTSTFRLQSAYQRLSSVGRQNLHFFIALAVAGYLSIAAIAAIPSLQETGEAPEAISVDKLRATVAGTPTGIDVKIFAPDNPFKDLESFLAQPQSEVLANAMTEPAVTAPVVPVPAPPSALGDAGARLPQASVTPPSLTVVPSSPDDRASRQHQSRRLAEGLLPTHKQMRQELLRSAEALTRRNEELALTTRKSAETIYAINIQRRGSRERLEHFTEVVGWYQRNLSTMNEATTNCDQSIRLTFERWRDWSLSMRNAIERASDRLDLGEEGIYRVYSGALAACQPPRINQTTPERPALGSYLGPFGIVASWLVRTESLPLALIVGLLGFGLLGSACSTFVRQQGSRRPDAPVIKDLPSVIIRGLSAAIVVFLAVEGGLAIFSTESPDPNPYVLVLTCLVAAVYSEDVWKSARERLLDRLRTADSRTGSEGPSGTDETHHGNDSAGPDEKGSS